jgi:hypothetical protein
MQDTNRGHNSGEYAVVHTCAFEATEAFHARDLNLRTVFRYFALRKKHFENVVHSACSALSPRLCVEKGLTASHAAVTQRAAEQQTSPLFVQSPAT